MKQVKITRRVFLGASAYVVTVPLFASALNVEKKLATISQAGQFFSANQLTVLVDVAEIMIPKTDTPGATDAQVVPVLDGLMRTWANQDTQTHFVAFIDTLNTVSKETYGADYIGLSHETRFSLLNEIDTRAFAPSPSSFSQHYKDLKSVIYRIYYSSEEANPNYALVPGGYRGCLSQAELDSIHANNGLLGYKN